MIQFKTAVSKEATSPSSPPSLHDPNLLREPIVQFNIGIQSVVVRLPHVHSNDGNLPGSLLVCCLLSLFSHYL